MRGSMVMAGYVLLAGCGSGGGGEAPVKEAVAATLGAGLYEVTAEVKALASTDKTTPATKLKLGDKVAAKACVAANGVPEPALLAEAGDPCTPQASYIRNGRMSLQLTCRRAGDNGNVLVTVDGKFTADGFTGQAETITQFYGKGDYKLSRTLTAKRVGDCPTSGAKAGA